MKGRHSVDTQFDLFIPAIVDLKWRDQKDTMERPFFSLSKNKRMKPIEYKSTRDGIFVTVRPHPEYGMATIWDADILIWAASVVCDLRNRGVNDIPRKLNKTSLGTTFAPESTWLDCPFRGVSAGDDSGANVIFNPFDCYLMPYVWQSAAYVGSV